MAGAPARRGLREGAALASGMAVVLMVALSVSSSNMPNRVPVSLIATAAINRLQTKLFVAQEVCTCNVETI